MTAESRDTRLRRLRMRSGRRGIREMDLILGRYAADRLERMDDARLAQYEALLEEPDQDLYLWVSGQAPVPDGWRPLIDDIAAHMRGT